MRMYSRLVVFAAALFLAVFFALSAAAQELASLSGRITDPKGLPVPGVKVRAANVNTNVAYPGETNDVGLYSIPSLPPGTYRIIVEKEGFAQIVKPDVVLHVADVSAINFSLQIGSITQSVTVEGGAPLINTESATVSTVVDRQFAENLPLNGRSFQTLVQLTPGVVLTPATPNDSGQFSVNGQRATSNYWMIDGVSANIGISGIANPGQGLGGSLGSFSVLGGTNSLVSVDAMQEFRIQTSTFAPEFGRTPGAQISVVTRSGTNQFHGTAFDYLRNDIFDANNWFNGYTNSPSLPKAKERQNDFGGTLSGPLLKDRTFFFFSYEGLRLRLPQTQQTLVPDLNARQNAIPAMQPFLKSYPIPNGADNTTTGVAQFNASYSNPARLDAYSLRIDHKINQQLTIFGRYNYSPSQLTQRGPQNNSPLNTVSPEDINTQTGTAGVTWNAAASVVNDLRFNYSVTQASSHYYVDNFGGAVPISSLPFPSPFDIHNAQLSLFNLALGTNRVLDFGQNTQNRQQQINVVDTISLQRREHSIKMGIDFRRLSPEFGRYAYQQFPLFFTVAQEQTGSPLLTIVVANRSTSLLFRNLGAFAQDTWRVVPRLTLTYGLRWDVDFAPSSISGPNFNGVTGFNLANLSGLALAPSGTPPYATKYANLAPRLGVAYQLSQGQDWQTVIRGGFGIFYDLASAEAGNVADTANYPFGAQVRFFGAAASFPLSASSASLPAITPPNATTGTLFAFDPSLRLPYTLQWNTGLEQALGRYQVISVSYLGASGKRLIQTANISKPNPNYSAAQLVTNASASTYNALQAQFQRRLSRGLQVLASYTWSHSIDTASAGSIGSSSNALTALSPQINRGPSDFDVRHAFSTGLTYDVPAVRGSGIAKAITEGWSAENVLQARSAPPVNVYYSSFTFLSSGFLAQARPNLVSGNALYLFGSQYPGGKALNPAAFAAPPLDPTTQLPIGQGSLPRNVLRGFGAFQWDVAIHRDFPIHEATKLQFRAEMFNILNHPSFGQPVGDLGSPSSLNPQFGKSSQLLGQSLAGRNSQVGAGAFSPLYQLGGPRSIQLALKLMF